MILVKFRYINLNLCKIYLNLSNTIRQCWTYTSRYDMVRQLIYTRPETPDSCMVRVATFKIRTKDLIDHFQDVNVFRCF
jgi:hypothetical protein